MFLRSRGTLHIKGQGRIERIIITELEKRHRSVGWDHDMAQERQSREEYTFLQVVNMLRFTLTVLQYFFRCVGSKKVKRHFRPFAVSCEDFCKCVIIKANPSPPYQSELNQASLRMKITPKIFKLKKPNLLRQDSALGSRFPTAWRAPRRTRRHVSQLLAPRIERMEHENKPTAFSLVTDTPLHPALGLPAQTKPNPAPNHFQPLRGVLALPRRQPRCAKLSISWALTKRCQG